MNKQKKRQGTPEAEKGANHWLLQEGYALKLDNPSLELCKLECESWLELMLVSDIDAALDEVSTIAAWFDEQLGKVDYVGANGLHWIDILIPVSSMYSHTQEDPKNFPKIEDIPLSVKIMAAQHRGLPNDILLTRQHLLAAAYRCIVHDYYMWDTVTYELKKAALNADEQGYHISVMYDPHKVFQLMCEVSALLALASHADIAKNGVMNIGGITAYARSSTARRAGKKGNKSYRKNKLASIAHYRQESMETGISKGAFARKYHGKYSVSESTLRKTLQGI